MILLKKNIQTTIQKKIRYGRYQFQSNVEIENSVIELFHFFQRTRMQNANISNVKKLCKVVSVKCLN
jgi:hypothetical protein